MSIEATLKRIPLFAHLTDAQLDVLARTGKMLSLPPHHVVVREGDESDDLYVILSGSAQVYRSDDQGREVTLATLQAGSYFGEQALLDSGPRSATIATLTCSELFVLDRTAFKTLILQS